MAIQTTVAKGYAARMVLIAVLCAVFGVWGIYDYVWAIPAQQRKYEYFQQLQTERQQLEKEKAAGVMPDEAKMARYDEINNILNQIGTPEPPSALDRATQWFFIASLPCAPWFFWLYLKARKQHYTLDDEGNLTFAGDPQLGNGQWTKGEMADIDMNRWMAKSIAWLVKTDGTRLKLDAYLHKDLHLIIGAIASRFHPDEWDANAKPLKKGPGDGEEPPPPLPPEDAG